MVDITILFPPCGAAVHFDNFDLATAFVRMLAHQITPDLFIDLFHKLLPAAPATSDESVRQILDACLGEPA